MGGGITIGGGGGGGGGANLQFSANTKIGSGNKAEI
jgi:hypothetical protein